MNKKKIALLCPGQGSQHIGMGYELCLAFPEAKDIFNHIDDTLSYPLSRLMFSGDIETLTATENAQPALFTTSVVTWYCLQKALNINSIADFASVAAGHSLGEYSALSITGSFSIDDGVQMVRKRGQAMSAAVPVGVGGMIVLLGADIDTAGKIAVECGAEIANDNGGGQIVLSGVLSALDKVGESAGKYGVKKAIKLQVSAPFHSSFMKPAAEEMANYLNSKTLIAPQIPVIANYTAEPYGENSQDIKQLLVKQICGSVRWAETMKSIVEDYGCEIIIELGAGKVLGNLAKRMYPNVSSYSIQGPHDIAQLAKEI